MYITLSDLFPNSNIGLSQIGFFFADVVVALGIVRLLHQHPAGRASPFVPLGKQKLTYNKILKQIGRQFLATQIFIILQVHAVWLEMTARLAFWEPMILNNEISCIDKYMLYVYTLLQKLNRHFEPGEEQGVLNKSKQGEKSPTINTYLKRAGDFSPRTIFH